MRPILSRFRRESSAPTRKPLKVTGGFKTLQQATEDLDRGVDMVGLARALVLDPALPNGWRSGMAGNAAFQKFKDPPESGITAWYTMRLTEELV